MANNQKKYSVSARFGPALKAVLLCALFTSAGVGFVWQKNQVFALGGQMKQLETRLAELRRQNKQRSDQLAFLRSPASLAARVKELKLDLVPPAPEQIWTLVEWPQAAPMAGAESRLLAQANHSSRP